jgi:hypothetical protein
MPAGLENCRRQYGFILLEPGPAVSTRIGGPEVSSRAVVGDPTIASAAPLLSPLPTFGCLTPKEVTDPWALERRKPPDLSRIPTAQPGVGQVSSDLSRMQSEAAPDTN